MRDDTAQRFSRAIKRLGDTRRKRALATGYTERRLQDWENGDVPDIIVKLTDAGVITINDTPRPRPEATEYAIA